MNRAHDALARTTLLLNQELFDGQADEAALADALLAATVRLRADADAVSTRGGQAAIVTACNLIARLGIGVELQVANAPLTDPVAPLRQQLLADALLDLGQDLIPGARIGAALGTVDEEIVFGEAEAGQSAVRVAVTDFGCQITRSTEPHSCAGARPYGGFAAGAAVAAIALEAAIPALEAAAGRPARTPRPSPGPPVELDLLSLFPGLDSPTAAALGAVDCVSGGAIAHALLFCLLRDPRVEASLRVIEEQRAELSNVNRYALLRASNEGEIKVEQLAACSSERIAITGVEKLFTPETRETILPFTDSVVVGVDDVRARWWVQEENPPLLAIGATSNHLAQLTTHAPGTACAGCIHTTPLPSQTIPTISFVSFWAGLLLACALVARTEPAANLLVYPFALGGPAGIQAFTLAPNPACPIACAVSRTQQQTRL